MPAKTGKGREEDESFRSPFAFLLIPSRVKRNPDDHPQQHDQPDR